MNTKSAKSGGKWRRFKDSFSGNNQTSGDDARGATYHDLLNVSLLSGSLSKFVAVPQMIDTQEWLASNCTDIRPISL